jgi:predicted Fe-Mo cluster-binding NifX family protein
MSEDPIGRDPKSENKNNANNQFGRTKEFAEIRSEIHVVENQTFYDRPPFAIGERERDFSFSS